MQYKGSCLDMKLWFAYEEIHATKWLLSNS